MESRTLFRAVSVEFEADPLPSRGAKGRFHDGAVKITYLASRTATAWREVLARLPDADPTAFRMVEIEAAISAFVDLTDPATQAKYGVTEEQLTASDHQTCRELAQRLRGARVEAVWTYSAADRPDGRQLVVFLDRLRSGSSVRVIAKRPVSQSNVSKP